MKKTIATIIALSALSTAALAGRSDYPSFSDIVPKDLNSSSVQSNALTVLPSSGAGTAGASTSAVDTPPTDNGSSN
jgi:hypothetical protein